MKSIIPKERIYPINDLVNHTEFQPEKVVCRDKKAQKIDNKMLKMKLPMPEIEPGPPG